MKDKLKRMTDALDGRVGYIIASQDGKVDIRNGEEQVFPSASIIKLSVLWAVFRKVSDGELSLTRMIPLRDRDIVGGYGVLQNIHPGVTLTVLDLCALMIHCSDNIAANFLIDLLGMEFINEEIWACGMEKTILQRKMMDAAARERRLDNYTSPSDMVRLMRQYRDSGRIEPPLRKQMEEILLGQLYNNFLAH